MTLWPIRDELAGIASVLDDDRLALAAGLPDEDLRRARDDTRALAELFIDLGELLRPMLGRFALGLGHLGVFIEDCLSTPDDRAFLLALIVALSQAGMRPGLHRLLDTAPNVRDNARAYRVIVAVREAIPEAAKVLSDRRYGAALNDPDIAAAMQRDIVKLREAHAAQIDAVLESIGELRARPQITRTSRIKSALAGRGADFPAAGVIDARALSTP